MKKGFKMYLNVKISKTNAKEPKKGFLFGKKGLIPFLRLSVTSTLNRGLVARANEKRRPPFATQVQVARMPPAAHLSRYDESF